MDRAVIKAIIDLIKDNYLGRKIVFYNPEKVSLNDFEFLKTNQNTVILNNLQDLTTLCRKKDKNHYFILWCGYNVQIEQLMISINRAEISDYIFRNPKPITIQTDSSCYSDNRGNKILNSALNIKFILRGYNNSIILNKGIFNDLFIEAYNNASIQIGSGVVFGKEIGIRINDNAELEIGNNCIFQKGAYFGIGPQGGIKIGEKCTFGPENSFAANYKNRLIIGDDALTARRILFQCGDGHSIFDVKTGEKKNYNDNENENTILIGNHVWIGGSVIILRNTVIGSGAYIGAHSFVKGHFQNNTLIIGNPAKVKRSDTSWGRSPMALKIENSCESLYSLKSLKLDEENLAIHRMTCFMDYLQELFKKNHMLILMSVKDILGYYLKQDLVELLNKLGVRNLKGKGWSGFVFVKKNDDVLCDKCEENESVSFLTMIGNHSIEVISAPLHSGNQSKIIIDEKDYSTNMRGFNIVLYDIEKDQLVDSVRFDTHLPDIPCYRKITLV